MLHRVLVLPLIQERNLFVTTLQWARLVVFQHWKSPASSLSKPIDFYLWLLTYIRNQSSLLYKHPKYQLWDILRGHYYIYMKHQSRLSISTVRHHGRPLISTKRRHATGFCTKKENAFLGNVYQPAWDVQWDTMDDVKIEYVSQIKPNNGK